MFSLFTSFALSPCPSYLLLASYSSFYLEHYIRIGGHYSLVGDDALVYHTLLFVTKDFLTSDPLIYNSTVATFVLAPFPNMIFSKCSSGDYYYSDNYNDGFKDFGHFLTSIFIITGLCLPLVLAHSEVITVPAMILSIGGGVLVYSTIIAYTKFFANEGDDF
ncbi:12567_t:CDS:2 [Acaulospora morrowiae]|uniref:12567_t:CDS:1 n=1 Tax=Acaulospora morrowiae TaxID=94023 RepID=A0A9N8ZBS9_9GLOM|nr:12567_t:CDS:2 [Acaulospora morrowiae]